MNRRTFHRQLGSLLALSAVHPSAALLEESDPLRRIGMSTVTFRNRFKQTNEAVVPEQTLTLLEVPRYFGERFGIRHVEFWSRHFESTEPAYLRDLWAAIERENSTLINIQLDEKYQLSAEDPDKRSESLRLALRWVDVAEALGSGAIRVNPGKGEPAHAIEALRQINAVAKQKGIVLMTENHFGMAMDPNLHVRMVQEVGDNMYTLPDFGNYDEEVRYEALRTVMPYAYQVSAKTMDFNSAMEHVSYDFDRCMKIAEESRFKGIYSLEQWSRTPTTVSDEAVVDWMIERIKPYC